MAQIQVAHNALSTEEKPNCGSKWMHEDEQCVQDLVACMHEFDSFPFNLASPTLCTLQSAMPASDELIMDFNSAHAAEEEKLTSFLQNQIFSKNTFLYTRVPLSKTLDICQGAMHGKVQGGPQGKSC